jgi:RNA polymerase primary sigma factor
MRGATTFSANPPVVTQPKHTQMASKANRPSQDQRARGATQPETDEMPEEQVPETSDRPVLDSADAAVRKMVNLGKERGYITQELLNSEGVTSEQIEDILAMLNEMGINVVESEESEPEEIKGPRQEREEEEPDGELVKVVRAAPAKAEKSEPVERTDDPVRMYLGEMGSVELLSREGEIAITKRIEAGREAMIAGLCESPLTFQAIIIWRDELNDGKVFLRDIIDLEATYAGPDAKTVPAVPVPGAQPGGEAIVAATLSPPAVATAPPTAPVGPTPFKPTDADGEGAEKNPRSAKPISMTTISKTRCPLPRSRPSSSRKCWRPSTRSPTPIRGCAVCRTRTSRTG